MALQSCLNFIFWSVSVCRSSLLHCRKNKDISKFIGCKGCYGRISVIKARFYSDTLSIDR